MDMLFSPIEINSMTVKNRLLMAPMGLLYTQDSRVNQRILAFFRERAKGGVGLIDVGGCKVHDLAGGPHFIGVDDDRYITGLKDLAAEVHRCGAKVIVQLYHPGSAIHPALVGDRQTISSSPVRSALSGQVPRPLLPEEIPQVQAHFADAAIRVRQAGFDGVDILGAAGYLISQFLSPLRNHREDGYGGRLENRMRFGLEIVDRVRGAVGRDFPLFFKMAANEFMEGGNGLEEAQIFAGELEKAGVDCIITAGGWHETRVPQMVMGVPAGSWLYLARVLKESVRIPVVACNQIRDPRMADRAIRDGMADMVGMGRAFLADPQFPNKAREKRLGEINHCIGCLEGCFDRPRAMQPVTCLVNPMVGREHETRITPSKKPKRVVIVGGGPAGMEAAWMLSRRGHKVTLHERSEALGGQLLLAGAPPGRRGFLLLKEYLSTQLERQKVDVRLNSPVDSSILLESGPDVVILATGAKPVPAGIPGADLPHVHQAWDVLMERVDVGKNVLILGGGATGCETALFLATKGTLDPAVLHFLFFHEAEKTDTLRGLISRGAKRVTILEKLPHLGKDIGPSTRWSVIQDLKRFGVEIITGSEARTIEKDSVIISRGGEEDRLPCDSVVLALGSTSYNPIGAEIRDAETEIHVIGDAKEPRKALEAVHEGFEIGLRI